MIIYKTITTFSRNCWSKFIYVAGEEEVHSKIYIADMRAIVSNISFTYF